MFTSFPEKSSESPASPLHRHLVHLDLWLKGILFIVIEAERSFKRVVGHKEEQGIITKNA